MTELSDLQVSDNGFLFQFEDESNSYGFFKESAGLIEVVSNAEMSAKSPRWAKVLVIGPDIVDVGLVPGARVLIDALRWSLDIKLKDGTSVWKSDESNVLVIED